MRLLYAEDELDILESTARRLRQNGHTVDTCDNGLDAVDFIEFTDYDAIILDIMMPGMDGLEVLRTIRENGNTTPVLLLTAKDQIQDRVAGLDAGSDDYLTKPFAYEELTARLRAIMRRPQQTEVFSNVLSIGELSMDTSSHLVKRENEVIELSAKEYAVLEYMLRNQNQVLSRDQIEHNAWGYDYEGVSNVVDVYIRRLRKKVDNDYDIKYIHTVRGAGYMLREPEDY